MRWVQALTEFRGRLRRRDFWLGLLILLLIEIALSFGFAGLMRPTGATPSENVALWLAFAILLWGSAALIIKRLHDRDKSALWYPLFGLAPALCYHLGVVYSSNITNVLSPAQRRSVFPNDRNDRRPGPAAEAAAHPHLGLPDERL